MDIKGKTLAKQKTVEMRMAHQYGECPLPKRGMSNLENGAQGTIKVYAFNKNLCAISCIKFLAVNFEASFV